MQAPKPSGVFLIRLGVGDRASGDPPKLALEARARDPNIQYMGTRVAVALGLALALGIAGDVHAQNPADQEAENPDAASSLLVSPNGAPPAAPAGEVPGRPPPRALDSKRTPMPDRLALPHWLQYYPLAPPTPPVPESGGATGGGANRVNTIFKKAATGGAPPDVPRDSVTRTPEDQIAPAPATKTP